MLGGAVTPRGPVHAGQSDDASAARTAPVDWGATDDRADRQTDGRRVISVALPSRAARTVAPRAPSSDRDHRPPASLPRLRSSETRMSTGTTKQTPLLTALVVLESTATLASFRLGAELVGALTHTNKPFIGF